MTRIWLKRILNLIVFTIAILYFLMDAIFATFAIPLSHWIASHWALERLHRWILSLKPYPTLLLFIVPLVILEPVKPLAAYLVATGHAVLGLGALAISEILKLVFIERLFSISRDKLLSIPAFAWAYGKYSAAKAWLTSLEAWKFAVRWTRTARIMVRRLVLKARGAPKWRRPGYLPLRAAAARCRRR